MIQALYSGLAQLMAFSPRQKPGTWVWMPCALPPLLLFAIGLQMSPALAGSSSSLLGLNSQGLLLAKAAELGEQDERCGG